MGISKRLTFSHKIFTSLFTVAVAIGCTQKNKSANNFSAALNSTSSSSSSGKPTGISPTPVPVMTPSPTPSLVQKSIKNYVKCDGVTDDWSGATAAFAAAKNNAFELIVDCPVYIKVGRDIGRAIFIDNHTTVTFEGSGKFIVDNVWTPEFVIVNSSYVTMNNWVVDWVGTMPIDSYGGYYLQNGTKYDDGGYYPPAGKFSDLTLKQWLSDNRGISGHDPIWLTPVNTSATFFIQGDSSHITISNMKYGALSAKTADHFPLVAFTFGAGYKNNQIVSDSTPMTSQYVAEPSYINITDLTFDGTIMGFVGSLRNSIFNRITSLRYSDLNDASYQQVGGNTNGAKCSDSYENCSMAPPHLFYLRFNDGIDPLLSNNQLTITNVDDEGIRLGGWRNPSSGNCLSLKIGAINSTVDGYISKRPDGFLDALNSNGLTIKNVTASYNSSYIQWPGWRFPGLPYVNSTFQNISVTDLAAVTSTPPLQGHIDQVSSNIILNNVVFTVNDVSGDALGNGIATSINHQGVGSLRTYVNKKTGVKITIDNNNVIK